MDAKPKLVATVSVHPSKFDAEGDARAVVRAQQLRVSDNPTGLVHL